MDGFTVSNSNRFLESGHMGINSSSSSSSGLVSGKLGGPEATEGTQKSFADTLTEAVGKVNELHKASDKASQELATGRTDNVADVMVAAEKADIALRLMVQVRNKIIDAYQDIMKMQV